MIKKSLFIIIAFATFWGCKKIEDQTMPDVNDQLTRLYCNDPLAVNYNDSFPGKPDNTTCFYPTEIFEGEWTITDSMYRPDQTLHSIVERNVIFIPVLDSAKQAINMKGWCNDHPTFEIKLKASRYSTANIINNIPDTDSGQVICNNDTLSGTLRIINNKDSIFSFSFSERKTDGSIFIHKGQGLKN